MRRLDHLGWMTLLICFFLAGCSEDNEHAATKPKDEQKTVVEKKEGPPEKPGLYCGKRDSGKGFQANDQIR
ncbi:hypothetical protein [Falsibacillus pallidus]|uniref:Lipoprotein n=1 Tax=Falsibacillus pallidus TaxID=493781 RepID=A0A370GH11_9BACI|nr:hypothetical protein [Falsibacillus pallidus]RDI41674.1 hypothetical protein DFR59_107129 [Falsibacillus pallidus]